MQAFIKTAEYSQKKIRKDLASTIDMYRGQSKKGKTNYSHRNNVEKIVSLSMKLLNTLLMKRHIASPAKLRGGLVAQLAPTRLFEGLEVVAFTRSTHLVPEQCSARTCEALRRVPGHEMGAERRTA